MDEEVDEEEDINKTNPDFPKDFKKSMYNEEFASFFATFAKAAKCFDKPTKLFFRGHKFFSAQSVMRSNLYPYKTFIHIHQPKNRVVISIGGPRNIENSFYSKIYSEDFRWIPEHQVLLENEFAEVYYTHIRSFLRKKLSQLKYLDFDPEKIQYIFNGHSIGASLAIYAAFDLTKSKVITSKKKPIVYSFGALRIGDLSLASQVNKFVDVWRITKQNDYLPRAPACQYIESKSIWNCKIDRPIKEPELNKNVFQKSVYDKYAYNYNSPIIEETKYYSQYKPKKPDLLSLYFNFYPGSKTYEDKNSENKYQNYITPIIVDEFGNEIKSNDSKTKDDDSKPKDNDTDLVTLDDAQTNDNKNKDETLDKDEDITKGIVIARKTPENKTKKNNSFIYSGTTNTFITVFGNLKKRTKRISKQSTKETIFENQLIQLTDIKPNPSINSNTDLRDLKKYWNNWIYFSPPLGRQVYYTFDGKIILCNRSHFGASTCELQYDLPKQFYSISSHNSYVGVDFGDCYN